MTVETRIDANNKTDVLKLITDRLNEIYVGLQKSSPLDYIDAFESQLHIIMMDIAQTLGLQLDYTPEGDPYMFCNMAGAGTKDKKFEEFGRE
jgi:hypothetical protein